MNSFKYIKQDLKNNTPLYVINFLLLIFRTLLIMSLPLVINVFVDEFLAKNINDSFIRQTFIIVAFITIAIMILDYCNNFFILKSAETISALLKRQLFISCEHMPADFFKSEASFYMIDDFNSQLEVVQQTLGKDLIKVSRHLAIGLTAIVLIAVINWPLALYCCLPLLLYVGLVHYATVLFNQPKIEAEDVVFDDFASKSLIARAEIQHFNSQALFERVVAEHSEEKLNSFKEGATSAALYQTASLFLLIASLVIAILIGTDKVIASTITLADYISFIIYLLLLIRAIKFSLAYGPKLEQQEKALLKINQFLDQYQVKADNKIPVSKLYGNIHFHNLSFAYPKTLIPTLKMLKFEIKAGQKVVVMGDNHSGKSTFVKLLLGFYTPPKSTLFYDDNDITSLDIISLRDKIAYVGQEINLFKDSIKNNLSLYQPEVKDKKIQHYAKLCGLEQEIETFPKGYESNLNKHWQLSTDGLCRLAIARGLIKNPDILIIDNPLISTIQNDKQKLWDNIDEELKGKTQIIISNDIEIAEQADLILVFDKGYAIDIAPPAEMLNKNEYYQQLKRKADLEYELTQSEGQKDEEQDQ